MKLYRIIFYFCLSFAIYHIPYTKYCFASERNIFGLHLTQTSDITKTKEIINSSQGDWGWATIVIRLDQLDKNQWQEYMDNCRKYHIIPIIRIGTIMDSGSWKVPANSDIDNISNFLNSLTWPTKTQYILPFNEINHGSEWGGAVDIKTFTDSFIYTSKKLKSLNPNFFILSSPLDLAAPENPPQFKSAPNIYKEIYNYNKDYFSSFDGLASHSYPNHGFIGTPNDTGQHSIRGYQWELNYLKSIGINKTYPVFITETGWPHREGESTKNIFYTTGTTAKFLSTTLDMWQNDLRIMAVTPFIYNYPYAPFDHFSWVDKNETTYPAYQLLIDKPKNKNNPEQITKFEVVDNDMPLIIFTDYEYGGSITLKNTGQSIWGETNFCLTSKSSPNITIDLTCNPDKITYPGQNLTLNYKFKINKDVSSPSTYISWDKIDKTYQITPLVAQGQIYHPEFNLKDRIFRFFNQILIK